MRIAGRTIRGSVLINLALVLGVGSLFTSGMLLSMGRFWRHVGTSPPPRAVPLNAASVTAAANVAGLDTDSLLAAGVAPSQFAAVAADAAVHVRDYPGNISDRANGPPATFSAVAASLTDAQHAALLAIRANGQ